MRYVSGISEGVREPAMAAARYVSGISEGVREPAMAATRYQLRGGRWSHREGGGGSSSSR